MVIPSVISSVQGRKAAAARLAVLIVLQALGLGAGWPQEPVQPRIDEEFAKQEKIYRRRGAGSYTTNRGLSDYAEVLPTGFCDALGRLGSADRWLDIGAGEGNAYSITTPRKAMRLLKSAADPGPRRARSRCP